MLARYYDGRAVVATPVQLKKTDTGLCAYDPDGTMCFDWPYGALVVLDQPAKGRDAVLSARHKPAVRLHLSYDNFTALAAEVGPHVQLKPLNASFDKKAAMVWAGGALPLIALLIAIFPYIVEFAAAQIPDHLMSALGDEVIETMADGRACHSPVGQDHLAALFSRISGLSPSETAAESRAIQVGPYSLWIVDDSIVNAFALPGKHIIVTSAFLKAAESPEEVAGVLAHELGHHQANHLAERLVTELTITLVIAAFTGGDGAILGDSAHELISLSYSRRDEEEADEIALTLLQQADINPAGLRDFFHRLSESEADGYDIFSTHPDSGKRAGAIAVDDGRTYTAALSPKAFQELQGICTSTEG